MKQRNNYEIVITCKKTGKMINYPQKPLQFNKIKVINPPVYYESNKELLEKVEQRRLLDAYSKRINNMMYRAAVAYWKEFESVMIDFFNRLENISTEEGNKLQVINKIKKKELVLN